MGDRFNRTAARARARQRLAQLRQDAAFQRADQIADRIEELHSASRRQRLAEAAAYERVAHERLAAARSLAAAAAEGYAEARCASGTYKRAQAAET